MGRMTIEELRTRRLKAMTSAERAEFNEALTMNDPEMTHEEEHEFYSKPENQEPQGLARRRRQWMTAPVPVRFPPNPRGHSSSIGVVVSPHVVELEVREPYLIWVRFDDGVAGVADLSDSAALGGIFAQWSDEGFWRSAHIVAESGAVAWGDGFEIDVCPLSLYLDVTGQTLEGLRAEATTTGAD